MVSMTKRLASMALSNAEIVLAFVFLRTEVIKVTPVCRNDCDRA